jgi:hypothetical protein
MAIGATVLSGVLLVIWLSVRELWKQASLRPENARPLASLRDAWIRKKS